MPDLDRADYELVLEERFDQPALDQRRWLPYHLPHWSSRAKSAAHYRFSRAGLELLIDADQQPWYLVGDGRTRISTLQTGEFAGPVGSTVGQHRFKPDLIVREEQPNVALLAPIYGLIECRATAIGDPANMVALWLIGYEDEPRRSAEICVFEIFGGHISADSARVGMGVHPHGDSSISDDFTREPVPINALEPHTYAARWTKENVSFYVDDQLIKVVDQSPDYPMQLMLSVFEFAEDDESVSPPNAYPKIFAVEWLKYWQARY